jgi:hypothetical protein
MLAFDKERSNRFTVLLSLAVVWNDRCFRGAGSNPTLSTDGILFTIISFRGNVKDKIASSYPSNKG